MVNRHINHPNHRARCLVQSGCSLFSRDVRGNSCLHWAAASSSAGKLAELLLGQPGGMMECWPLKMGKPLQMGIYYNVRPPSYKLVYKPH